MFGFFKKDKLRPHGKGKSEDLPILKDEGNTSLEAVDKKGNRNIVDGRLVIITQPHSIAAEQYRVLSTRISLLMRAKPSYVLAVTSAVKGEGKTFTTLNMAISMAKDFDEKVLLIEGDLKNPDIHEYLKQTPGFGLSDVLGGKVDFDSAAMSLFDGRLKVLFAGTTAGNPIRLLASKRMQELMEYARSNFKIVIIDTPPAIPLADISLYSTYVDGILIVVKAGKTPRSLVKKAIEAIPSEKIIGVVLNEVEANYSRYYYGTKYSY